MVLVYGARKLASIVEAHVVSVSRKQKLSLIRMGRPLSGESPEGRRTYCGYPRVSRLTLLVTCMLLLFDLKCCFEAIASQRIQSFATLKR